MDLGIKMPSIKPEHSLMALSIISLIFGVLAISIFFTTNTLYQMVIIAGAAFILIFHGALTLAGIKVAKKKQTLTSNDAVIEMAKGLISNPEALQAIAGNIIKPPVVKCKVCGEPMTCIKQDGLKFTYYCAKDNRTVDYVAPININDALSMLKGDKNGE